MSEVILTAFIGAAAIVIPATVAGIWRLWRLSMKRARDEALATARSEALIREANATVEAKNRELTTKDAVIADLTNRNAELRQLAINLSNREVSP